MTQDNARHSIAEHKELDDFVEKLSSIDMSSPGWLRTAKELESRLIHRLDEEEIEVFPVAGRALDDEEKVTLGAAYCADIDRRRNED